LAEDLQERTPDRIDDSVQDFLMIEDGSGVGGGGQRLVSVAEGSSVRAEKRKRVADSWHGQIE